jgi:hypothetical protein
MELWQDIYTKRPPFIRWWSRNGDRKVMIVHNYDTHRTYLIAGKGDIRDITYFSLDPYILINKHNAIVNAAYRDKYCDNMSDENYKTVHHKNLEECVRGHESYAAARAYCKKFILEMAKHYPRLVDCKKPMKVEIPSPRRSDVSIVETRWVYDLELALLAARYYPIFGGDMYYDSYFDVRKCYINAEDTECIEHYKRKGARLDPNYVEEGDWDYDAERVPAGTLRGYDCHIRRKERIHISNVFVRESWVHDIKPYMSVADIFGLVGIDKWKGAFKELRPVTGGGFWVIPLKMMAQFKDPNNQQKFAAAFAASWFCCCRPGL